MGRFCFISIGFLLWAFLIHNTQIARQLHSVCQRQIIKSNKRFVNEKLALICGKKINQHFEKSLITQAGLIHIFVVSGAHLNFYKKCFVFLFGARWGKYILSLFLILFTFTCNNSPPILRATAEHFIKLINHYFKLNFIDNETILLSGILAIALLPAYSQSLSLQLSLICTLVMRTQYFKVKTFILYFIISPVLLLFTVPNPVITIPSFLLTLLITSLLFPMTLLTSLFHNPLQTVTDLLYTLMYRVLEVTTVEIQTLELSQKLDSQKMILLIWLYIAILIYYFMHLEKKHKKIRL